MSLNPAATTIGTTLEGRPNSPVGAALWGLAAVVCAAIAALFEIAGLFAMAAILTAIAVTVFASRERLFRARFDETGLALLHLGEHLPYAHIESLAAGPLAGDKEYAQYTLDLRTATKIVRVPAAINIPTGELERFLRSHMPPRLVAVPDPDVDEYLNRQIAHYGASGVFWYGPARDPVGLSRPAVRRAWLACFLAGLVVLIVGVSMMENKNRAAGIRRGVDQYTGVVAVGAISLVVALRQGDLKGELKWEEIRGVQLPRNKPLTLQLAGVTIQIFNIYDRSLVEIHDRIREVGRLHG